MIPFEQITGLAVGSSYYERGKRRRWIYWPLLVTVGGRAWQLGPQEFDEVGYQAVAKAVYTLGEKLNLTPLSPTPRRVFNPKTLEYGPPGEEARQAMATVGAVALAVLVVVGIYFGLMFLSQHGYWH